MSNKQPKELSQQENRTIAEFLVMLHTLIKTAPETADYLQIIIDLCKHHDFEPAMGLTLGLELGSGTLGEYVDGLKKHPRHSVLHLIEELAHTRDISLPRSTHLGNEQHHKADNGKPNDWEGHLMQYAAQRKLINTPGGSISQSTFFAASTKVIVTDKPAAEEKAPSIPVQKRPS